MVNIDHPDFWYFRYGAQKKDKHWFEEFTSEDAFSTYLSKSRWGWLCTQFKLSKMETLYVLENIPPIGGSMSEKLDNPIIRDWWRKVAEHAKSEGLKDYQGIHEPIFHPIMNRYRIMVSQIRTEPSYNYLCSLGIEVNNSGEIFLTENEALGYINFQRIMEK